MKINKIGYSSLYILMAIVFMLPSCTDKSSLLVNTWKLDNLKYNKQIPPAMQATIDNSIKQLKSSFSLTYNADGTYMSRTKDMETHGTWKLNPGSTKITSTNDKGQSTEYEIMKLTSDHFEFKAQEGKEEVIFVMEPAK